ncbi:MarR family winged helix-turn-helix transcriptional regulator [Lacticaseibacillus absianus]|uniref:MarR family winged helix-turn-helix transcriptional regulator n=1 Tax=Lacticaseibacillus absianus TaxID=2729623 RepID=UPI0015CAFA7C|nr:MarR family transcriptional regulator [Lacticaseibacillus absianus]
MPDLGYTLITLTKQLKTALNRALADHDVTVTQWALVAGLHRHSPQTAAELVQALDIDKPTVSDVVRRLSAKGLITSRPKPGDRRAKLLALTPAGEAAYGTCAAIADQVVETFLTPLSLSQREQLTALLASLEGAPHD